jgi:mono/diheme cytochrome c family protein/glucose/arabinose dehydrogenase
MRLSCPRLLRNLALGWLLGVGFVVPNLPLLAADSDLPTYAKPPAATTRPNPVQLPIQPVPGETVAMVGNSLGERMLYFGYFETGLQLRYPQARVTVRNLCNPGDTPGFRPNSARKTQWAFPGAEKFHPELSAHFGIGHYPSPDEWLFEVKADTILAFFGYNESFDGLSRVDNFKAELAAFVDHTLSLAYNGRTAPRLILVTPIAFEDRTDAYDLPKGEEENRRLQAYARAVLEVAREKGVGAIDLFGPTREWFAAGGPKLTINGCHLSDAGYARLAPYLLDRMYGPGAITSTVEPRTLRAAVEDKDWFWFNDYRMLNGVHVYGQRYKPFGNVNYPEEIEKMRQMTRLRDVRIWDMAGGKVTASATLPPVPDHQTRALTPIETNFKKPIEYLGREKALERFTMREGYKIEMFASESEFPDLKSPVQMSFDNRGRLWVSVIPSYPHYKPGDERPNDKILIFEDTDGDGRADKQTVFADHLNLPIGFEIAPEGVYVSQEPHLCLLIDEDKDDRADRMEILLTGFDTHDTHHAISAYAADASGSFYLLEGRFLHSQVETPYGPERMTDGGAWRFDPKRYRLERYSQSDYNNPWGMAFDEWDQGYISDASSGQNWWGLPVSAKIPHGLEIPKVGEFAPKRARPTSGSEFVSSRHFPDDVQGNFMICNSIGFLGTSLHKVWEDGSGFDGKHIGDLVSSTDPNFRPVDLETAPDGSLYFVDWHNALIGHMQHNARDPNRDRDHGRIYRITYPSRPLVKPARIAGAPLEELFENLKLPEYRSRYRTRRELRGRPAAEVIPAVKRWAASLDRQDPNYEHHLCEALWVTWGYNAVDRGLLELCLHARAHQARAAAVHVLRYAHRQVADSLSMFLRAANDPHGRVRLEAIVAASWMDTPAAARIVLEALKHPFDRWMGPVTDQILKTTLADDLKVLQADPKFSLADNPKAQAYLAGTFKFEPAPKSEADKAYGPTRQLTEAEQKVYARGKEIFNRDAYCITCHQPNGLGMPNIYPPLVAKDNPWLSDNDERLIKVVLKGLWGPLPLAGQLFDPSKGVPPMTGFGGLLNDDEIAAVLSYVRQSFGNNLPFIDPATVRSVRAKVADRQDFYLVEDLMKEHPIQGWESWPKASMKTNPFE